MAITSIGFGDVVSVPTSRLLGRSTAGTGSAEALTASAARTLLSLVPGTDVQAYDAQLSDIASLSYTGNTLKVVRVNAGETAFELATISSGVTDHGALTGLSDDDHSIYLLLAGRSGSQTINGDTASGGSLQIHSTAHATKGTILFNGTTTGGAHVNASREFSNPGAQTDAEKFGASAVVGGTNACAFGKSASANGTNAIAFGKGASSTGTGGIGIGTDCTAGTGIAIGGSATASSSNGFGIAIGNSSNANGIPAVALGTSANASRNSATAIGYSATGGTDGVAIGRESNGSSLANSFVAGSDTSPITNVFFGEGITNATPLAYTINGTGGSGTNIAGAAVNIAGGKGTGTGAGGPVNIQAAPAGASGTAANALVTGVQVDADVTAGNTRLLVYDVDNGTLERVTVGAADSGGTGYKVLRIPN